MASGIDGALLQGRLALSDRPWATVLHGRPINKDRLAEKKQKDQAPGQSSKGHAARMPMGK